MSGYKVFQCASMDYHLEPARYETVTTTKLAARYNLVMNCDFITKLQDSMPTSGDLIDVEGCRSALCSAFYKASAGASNGANPINEQWQILINTVLRATAWIAQVDSDTDSRVVDQAKVNSDMTYVANITSDGNVGDLTNVMTVDAIDGKIDEDGVVTSNLRKVAGLAADASATQYDAESIGQLINNTNMREILLKMRNHGCFIQDDDQPSRPFVVNPVVRENTNLGDASDPANATLLNVDDELVFPVNVKSIVGHTATGSDEILNHTYAVEINIVFKQTNV